MNDLAHILGYQLHYTHGALLMNLEGVSDEQALRQPAGGNCINWVAGHIMATRCGILELLGKTSPWDESLRKRYRRGSLPILGAEDADAAAAGGAQDGPAAANGIKPLSEILADFTASQSDIQTGLAAATPERLAKKSDYKVGGDDDETIGGLLATLVFHEAYHCGQIGLLRRVVGHPGAIS